MTAQQILAVVVIGCAALISAVLAWRDEAAEAASLFLITVGLVLWLLT